MPTPQPNPEPTYTPEEERKRIQALQNYWQNNTSGWSPLSMIGGAPNVDLSNRTGYGFPYGAAPQDQSWVGQRYGVGNQPATLESIIANLQRNPRLMDTPSQDFLNQLSPNIPAVVTRSDPGAIQQQAQQDATLTLLQSMLGNRADVSGFDAILGDIANQRKQASKRYQTYSAQISDLFGNLGRKSTTYAEEQAAIGESAAATRSQLAAQQAQRTQSTREADALRLKTANEARAALGGQDFAAATAGGDIVTQQTEQALTDQAALGQTTIDTILANEALAKLMSSRQAGGFDIAGQQAQQQLNMSYEDLLSALGGQEAQTKMQRSQAISAGAPSVSEQLAVMNATQNFINAQANTGTSSDPATVWMQANPASAAQANRLLSTFIPWVTSEAPSVDPNTGKTPTLLQLVNAYSKKHPQGAKILQSDPALYSLIQAYTGLK
jgi:hypothetical protein